MLCGQEWKGRNPFLMPPSFYLTPVVHRSLPGLIRTMKIWGTCDTFTQEHDFSYLCLHYAITQKGKRNKDVFALLSSLPPPRAVSSPSLGKKHLPLSERCYKILPLSERCYKYRRDEQWGWPIGLKWQQKTRTGKRNERWWQARDKRRANLETVQQEGPTAGACSVNLASKGYRNYTGRGPSVIPIIIGNGLVQQNIPYVHRTRYKTFLMARSQPLSSCQQGWRTSLFWEQSAQHRALPVLMVMGLWPPSAPALKQRAGNTEFLPIWWLNIRSSVMVVRKKTQHVHLLTELWEACYHTRPICPQGHIRLLKFNVTTPLKTGIFLKYQ